MYHKLKVLDQNVSQVHTFGGKSHFLHRYLRHSQTLKSIIWRFILANYSQIGKKNVENVHINSFNYYLSLNTVHTAPISMTPCHWVRFIGYLFCRILSKPDEECRKYRQYCIYIVKLSVALIVLIPIGIKGIMSDIPHIMSSVSAKKCKKHV